MFKKIYRRKMHLFFICMATTFSFLLSACSPSNSSVDSQNKNTLKITHVRNATTIIDYAGKRFLVDPMLSGKGTMDSFGTYPNAEKNPLNELTMDFNTILDVDAILVTHLHSDHFDKEAVEIIPKDIPVFSQNEADQRQLQSYGFKNVIVLDNTTFFNNISLIKTECQHGETSDIAKEIGDSCGIIIKADNEKTIYITGDTVWYDGVKNTLNKYKPEIVIAYAGANTLYSNNDLVLEGIDLTGYNGYLRLIMDENDVLSIHQTLPTAQIIATHMESLNHNVLSRKDLRTFSEENNFSDVLQIPLDGEILEY